MKTLKTIITILLLNTCFTNCLNAQSDTGSVWVTFKNQLDVPVQSGDKFVSSKQEIQQLIEQFNIYSVTQALPDSKQEKLKRVYEVNCVCNWEELENEMDKLSFLDYPVKAPEYELLYDPNDYNTIFTVDYALDLIDAKTAWDYSHGDTNIIIGVSDGNFYPNHEELQYKIISNVSQPGGPASYYNHGTAVAITAAGSTENGIGKSSIGFDCRLSLSNMGYNHLLNLSYGGARVINASWTSGCSYNGYIQTVIDEIYNNGTIVVAAAGNASCGNPNNLVYPAACDHVIAVSSIGPNNNHERTIGDSTTTHQHNSSVDLCAPGYDVALSGNAGWYLTSSGTSFAAPYVSGTIGLMLAIRPCLTYEEALYILQSTAFNLDSLNPNYAGKLGAGRIDAGLALEFTKNLSLSISANVTNATCFGENNGTIDIVTNVGAGTNSFFWSTVNGSGLIVTQEDQSNLTPGNYNLLIEDAQGCSLDTTFTISSPSALNINSTVAAFSSGANISCFGVNDGNIDIQMTGGSGSYNYTWSTTNGSGLQAGQGSQSALSAGVYSLIVVDSNNCEVSETFNLVEPAQLEVQFIVSTYASGDNIACFGSNDGSIEVEVAGNAANCSFNWSTTNGQGLVNSIQNQNNLTAGTYFLTITDLNGCSIQDSIVLNEPEELTLDLTILSNYYGQPVSCEGSEDGVVKVSASGGTPDYSFIMNNTQPTTQDIFSSAKSGENTFVLIDLNGCETISTILLTANPTPQLNPSPRIDACLGENVTINSNILENEYCVWKLSNGMTIFDNQSAVINIPNAGCIDASFMVTNEFGCTDSVFYENYICMHSIPVASFIADHLEINENENDVNFTNNSDGATQFEWYYGDGTSSTEMNPFHYYDAVDPVQGNYEVTLFAYNDYGCYDSTSQKITVKVKDDLLLYVPNSFTPNGDEFNNTFKPVYGSSFTLVEYDLLIYNRWGEIVFQSMDISTGWDGTIKGQIAPEGVYIWKLNIKTDDRIMADSNSKQMTGNINLIR